MVNDKKFTWITEIHIVDYDPGWPGEFKKESRRLRAVLGDRALAIHHIGSTAVRGLPAKPVVDLMVEVADLGIVQQMTDQFEQAGYEVLGESGIPGRHFITRNALGKRTHDIHIFQTGHREIDQMILFRDHLRQNPDAAKAYGRLKKDLAEQFRHEPIAYTQAKSDFIMNAVMTRKEQLSNQGE